MSTSHTTVVLFCGLPASGKSTLARKLKDHYFIQQSETPKQVVHLEYDAFEDLIVSQEGGEEEERRDAWNQARQVAVKDLEQKIQEGQGSFPPLLILMDDNFHLRGMRKQIHRLLLKYRPIKFGLVWMEASLDVCLERNRDRERQIPEHVILKMESTFEPPRAAWENYWMTATSKTSTETVVDFIEQCSEIVDLPEVTDPEQQEADRAKTLQNQQHCWDKMLRSWVGQVAKHDKQLARGANMARKVLLQRMKAPNPDITDATFLLDSFLDLVLSSSQKAGDDPTNASSEIPLRSTLKKLLTESS